MSLRICLFMNLGLLALALAAGCASKPEAKPEPTSTRTAVERGADLYNANCLTCHGGATGGTMMDMPPRHNTNGHTWHHSDCQLIDIVLNGSGEMGEMMRRMMGTPTTTPRMPSWRDKLSEDDVRAILSFIKTWWTESQRQLQARATQQQC